MLRKIEKNAKSKEEALQLAAEEFGVPVEELSYKVEREVGKGLMGLLLGREVIISAWITKEAEEEEAKLRKAMGKDASAGPNPYAPKVAPEVRDYAANKKGQKAENKQESKQPVKAEKMPVKKEEIKQAPASVPQAETETEAVKSENRKRREVTPKSLEDAQYFVTELVHKMGLADAAVQVENGGEAVDVTVAGSRMGLLIGKRGDTLDAVQYLTSLYVNKPKNSYIKVNVDTEGYREKRAETLVRLGKSLEKRVVKERREVTLEPMSPNERRIIHAALQNSDKVKTFSVGEEPHRKIVVAPK